MRSGFGAEWRKRGELARRTDFAGQRNDEAPGSKGDEVDADFHGGEREGRQVPASRYAEPEARLPGDYRLAAWREGDRHRCRGHAEADRKRLPKAGARDDEPPTIGVEPEPGRAVPLKLRERLRTRAQGVGARVQVGEHEVRAVPVDCRRAHVASMCGAAAPPGCASRTQ